MKVLNQQHFAFTFSKLGYHLLDIRAQQIKLIIESAELSFGLYATFRYFDNAMSCNIYCDDTLYYKVIILITVAGTYVLCK